MRLIFEQIDNQEVEMKLDQAYNLIFSKMEEDNTFEIDLLQSNKKYHIVNIWKNITPPDK